jgi:hypothetical protein
MAVTAQLALDTSNFTVGLSSAEAKLAKFGAKMTGASGGFKAFNMLLGGWGYAIEEADGKASSLFKTLGRAALTAGLVYGVTKSFEALGEAIEDVQNKYTKLGFEKPNGLRLLASSLFNAGPFTQLLPDTWREAIAGKIMGPLKTDPFAQARMKTDKAEESARAVIKAETPLTVEEKLRNFILQNPTSTVLQRTEEFRRLKALDEASTSRMKETDSLTRIGLNTAYAGGVEYAQRTANATEQAVQLLRDFISGKLSVVNGVSVAQ